MSDPRESELPPDPDDPAPRDSRRRRLVESVIPEILKRAVELGVEKAQEAPDNLKQFVNDMRLPKEIAHYLLQQIDETKNGLFRVVAKEIRDFLEHTNFAGEVQKLLTTVQFEINTTIRFTPNDGPSGKNKRGKDDKADKADKADKTADNKKSDVRTATREDGREEAPDPGGEPEAAPESGGAPHDDEPEAPVTSLPRPEVKTAVNVRRDEHDRRKRRGAG